MEHELDITYKNLEIQKKYLSNLNSLYQFKAYQNKGMELDIDKAEKIVKKIEEFRFNTVNNYEIIHNFEDVLFELKLLSEDEGDWYSDLLIEYWKL